MDAVDDGNITNNSDYSRYQESVRAWSSVAEFLSAPLEEWGTGVHILGADDQHLDLFIGGRPWVVRAGRCLPVFLTGAVSTRDGKPGPFFSGLKLAREVGTPFLSLSDPTLRLDQSLDLGWYTGALGAGTQERITHLLDGVGERVDRELLLVGGSGGGFASLDQSDRMRQPVSALVWNAQTDLLDYSPPAVLKYLVAVTQRPPEEVAGWSQEERARRLAMGGVGHTVHRPLGEQSGRRRLLYLQNSTDAHLHEHALPFLAAAGWAEGMRGSWRDERGGLAIAAPMSQGHLPPPREVLTTALQGMLEAQNSAQAVADLLDDSSLLGLGAEPWKVRTLLVGSCVSRDTFAFLDPQSFSLSGYVARQSLVSAFAGATAPVISEAALSSRFQRRVLLEDAGSSLSDVVRSAASEVDLVIWDLVDERLGVHRNSEGGLTTDSVEIRSVLGSALPEGVERVEFGTPEHLDLFTKALPSWRALLEESGLLSRTVLLTPLWAEVTDVGGIVPDSFGMQASMANSLMEPYLDAVVRVLGVPLLGRSGPPPLAGSTHQWGPAPFHYADDTYVRLAEKVVESARQLHGPGAISGLGVRVPSAAERSPRQPSTTVILSRSGNGLAATLSGGEMKAWSVQLYRGDQRVANTSWQRERVIELPLASPGAYRARAHLLTVSGDRLPLTSAVLHVN